MVDYLQVNYFNDEYKENAYPQKLCDYLIDTIIRPHFSGEIKGLKLLDMGSGKGNHLIGFHRRNFNVKGMDFRPECLSIFKEIDIRDCNMETSKFPFLDETFDVVFSKSVIEHIQNIDNVFTESFRVLKRGGLAIIMTPDWGTQYKTFWDDYTHVKAWTRKSLQNVMKIFGFVQVNSTLFNQLPLLWKYPQLKFLYDVVSLLPEAWKWKDKDSGMVDAALPLSMPHSTETQ